MDLGVMGHMTLTTGEAARFLGLKKANTLVQRIKRGKGPEFEKRGKRYQFKLCALVEYCQTHGIPLPTAEDLKGLLTEQG